MSFINRQIVAVTCDGSGNATVYTNAAQGLVLAIQYIPDGSVPLTNSASVTVTEEDTTAAIITISAIGSSAARFCPQAATVSTANAAALYAAAGTAVNELIPIFGRVKFVISGGGASNKGTFYVYIS